MRYRPFSHSGMAISALSLTLTDPEGRQEPGYWRSLVHAAFEAGINAFDLQAPTPSLVAGFAEGISVVERRLLFIGLQLRGNRSPKAFGELAHRIVAAGRLTELDLLTVEGTDGVAPDLVDELSALKAQGLARRIGVAGECDVVEDHVLSGRFDALVCPYSILSGWRDRRMIREAVDQQMAVMGSDPFPERVRAVIQAPKPKPKVGWFSKPKYDPLDGVGTYAFLTETANWTPEQICIGYALTEPSLASVQVIVDDPVHLAEVAEATERVLPTAAGAQIEMARFSADEQAAEERRRA
ncbi:MAG: aldo/keto reductase [Caulobacterales bacterium]